MRLRGLGAQEIVVEDVPGLVKDIILEDTGDTLKIADAEFGTSILVLVAYGVGVPPVIARVAETVSVSESSMVIRIGIYVMVTTVSADRGPAMNTGSPRRHWREHDLPLPGRPS